MQMDVLPDTPPALSQGTSTMAMDSARTGSMSTGERVGPRARSAECSVTGLAYFSLFSLNSELSQSALPALHAHQFAEAREALNTAGVALSFHGLSLHFPTYADLP